MRKPLARFHEPVGPWTALHSLGAGVVVALFATLTWTAWPGWAWTVDWWAR